VVSKATINQYRVNNLTLKVAEGGDLVILRNVHRLLPEKGHGDTVTAWTLFRGSDFLSKVSFINDNLVDPGVAIELHEHVDLEEVYYILSGIGEIRVGDEVCQAREGDAVYLPPRVSHTMKNIGSHPLRFICVGAMIT
jgi:mannose-6-phosphate isomerase-like protein (cupin superfamily)